MDLAERQGVTPGLTFDEGPHRYYWNGRPVPNVTSIIAPWTDWSLIPPERLEAARQRGKARHKMVEVDCLGLEHEYTWPEWIAGARMAWERFKDDTGFICWTPEKKLYHRVYGYAGTADLFGELPKLGKKVNGPANIDVKGSEYAGPAIGLQLGAYTQAWNEDAPKDLRIPMANRFALILGDDGKYRLSRYPDPEDWIDFLAALRQHRFRERHYPKTLS